MSMQHEEFTLEGVLSQLKSLGSEKVRSHYKKRGSGNNQFGVKLGDIRKMAKNIKFNQKLAMELWDTENIDARFLAILLMKPNQLSLDEMENLVGSVEFDRVADWINAYIVKKHKKNELLREKWMDSDNPMVARAGWNLTAIKIEKNQEGLDLSGFLDRIESEMENASPLVQWTMNNTLVAIGTNSPKHRKRAIAIGESLGIYRDYPVPKGCTSPFAPIWINEMVKRKKNS